MEGKKNFLSPHFGKIFRNQVKTLSLIMLFLFVVQILFMLIMATSGVRSFIEAYFELLPPFVKEMIGIVGKGFVGKQFIAFGYAHPVVIALICFIPISIASRYITGEIDKRSIELLANRLLPRTKMVVFPYAFVVLALVLVFSAMVLGSVFGKWISGMPDDINSGLLFRIAGVGILFFSALSSVILFYSVIFSKSGKTIAWGAGTILVLFIFDAIVRMWTQISFLKDYSLFSYYSPTTIASGEFAFGRAILILLFIILVFLPLSLYRFNQRDL